MKLPSCRKKKQQIIRLLQPQWSAAPNASQGYRHCTLRRRESTKENRQIVNYKLTISPSE